MQLQLFGGQQEQGTMELIPRVSHESALVLALFVACIFLISLARLRQRSIFKVIAQNTFLFRTQEDLVKEGLRPNPSSRLLLTLLFAFITSGAIYWYFFVRTPLTNWKQLFIPLFIPTFYMMYQIIVMYLAGLLAGKRAFTAEVNYFTLGLHQFLGILILVEFFISYFQPTLVDSTQWLLIVTYLVCLIFRVLRCFFLATSYGVAWYYFILYFWSLEILPILIVAKLLFYEEFQTWIG